MGIRTTVAIGVSFKKLADTLTKVDTPVTSTVGAIFVPRKEKSTRANSRSKTGVSGRVTTGELTREEDFAIIPKDPKDFIGVGLERDTKPNLGRVSYGVVNYAITEITRFAFIILRNRTVFFFCVFEREKETAIVRITSGFSSIPTRIFEEIFRILEVAIPI